MNEKSSDKKSSNLKVELKTTMRKEQTRVASAYFKEQILFAIHSHCIHLIQSIIRALFCIAEQPKRIAQKIM